MRTTVRLNDQLFRQVKAFTHERGMTFTALMEEALRRFLQRKETAEKRHRVKLVTFRGKGLHPGVDLDDTSTLLDLMESSR